MGLLFYCKVSNFEHHELEWLLSEWDIWVSFVGNLSLYFNFLTGNVNTELREPAAASCEPQRANILYQMLGILKSRQPVSDRSETQQNMQQGKPSATRLLYQVLGSKEPEVLGNKASKVAYEDNKNAVNLHNELNISSNVPKECKNVPHFSVICWLSGIRSHVVMQKEISCYNIQCWLPTIVQTIDPCK